MTQLAALFDMDGTLINNNPYHLASWQELFKRHGKPPVSQQTFNEYISGVPSAVVIRKFFDDVHSDEEFQQLTDERNGIYYNLYRPYIAPVNGLENLLAELKNAGWKLAIASSAIQRNIDFILDSVPIRQYFEVIMNSTQVHKPKPDPQIFLKAAEKLQVPPVHCVVFEDSLSGVKAAGSAGMKVVALTTTHKAGELHPVDLVVDDYTGLSAQKLANLFN